MAIKKTIILFAFLSLMISVGTTAHAATCVEKIKAKVAHGKITTFVECVKFGLKSCRQASEAEIEKICSSFGLNSEQSWSDVVVDRVAIEQRVLK